MTPDDRPSGVLREDGIAPCERLRQAFGGLRAPMRRRAERVLWR